MMIVSAKVSKKKALAALLAAAAVVALLVFLCGRADASGGDSSKAAVTDEAPTNEARLAFLRQLGWEIDETPTETQEVRIPEEFNDVFTRYNQLQQTQGYDLSSYAGKCVKRYVYRIRNHPDGDDYFATLLLYKNKIIGGDVTGTGQGGGIHGLKPE